MAVDLITLIPALKAEVSPPGEDLFADAADEDWVMYLQNAFWGARLDGFLTGYTESGGEIEPLSGTDDIPRHLQQIIVFYAHLNVVMNSLRNLKTSFRTKAGPVEYETSQSAVVLRDLLKALTERKKLLLETTSDYAGSPTYVLDAVGARLCQSWYSGGFVL